MTLTVRLDDTLETALERYCAATGATKSLVVQESLARYLLASQAQPGEATRAAVQPTEARSHNHRAFEAAGLVGCVAVGPKRGPERGPEQRPEQGRVPGQIPSANKAAVRARVATSFAQRQARPGGR